MKEVYTCLRLKDDYEIYYLNIDDFESKIKKIISLLRDNHPSATEISITESLLFMEFREQVEEDYIPFTRRFAELFETKSKYHNSLRIVDLCVDGSLYITLNNEENKHYEHTFSNKDLKEKTLEELVKIVDKSAYNYYNGWAVRKGHRKIT